MAELTARGLPTIAVGDIDKLDADERWLIRPLLGRSAVAVLAGQPKLGKSWCGLSMAVSVASGRPCFGRFPVERQGPALVYMAEETAHMVRERVDALCDHLELEVSTLDLHVITAPSIRLDVESDQLQLSACVEKIRPAFVLLDPLVRLHRCEENSASEISALLGYLRTLQRTFDTNVTVVHHVTKRARARPGQNLRGSGDLHGWLDNGLYLTQDADDVLLTIEQRSARAHPPIPMRLVTRPDGTGTHFEVVGDVDLEVEAPSDAGATVDLEARLALFFDNDPPPISRTALRRQFRVNNQRLGDALGVLAAQGGIERTDDGWRRKATGLADPSPF